MGRGEFAADGGRDGVVAVLRCSGSWRSQRFHSRPSCVCLRVRVFVCVAGKRVQTKRRKRTNEANEANEANEQTQQTNERTAALRLIQAQVRSRFRRPQLPLTHSLTHNSL